MMRVVNQKRWHKAKVKLLALCFLGALYCGGGLEGSGTDAMPSPAGFVALLALSFWMLQNVSKPLPLETERERFVRTLDAMRQLHQDQHPTR